MLRGADLLLKPCQIPDPRESWANGMVAVLIAQLRGRALGSERRDILLHARPWFCIIYEAPTTLRRRYDHHATDDKD